MKYSENPFTVIFGVEPKHVIPRMNDFSQIVSVFESTSPRTFAYVITGVRGCGKTVLMTSVQNYFDEKKDWYVLRLNPDMDLFESAISQLNEVISLPEETVMDVSVSLAGFGGGVSKRSLSDNDTLLRKMIKKANDNGKKVLIAIDEATNSENLKTFAHSYQAYIGEKLKVFLLMTSLPENFVSLSNSKNGTFLKRLPKIVLGKLNESMIRNAYSDIFEISLEEARVLSDIVKGYPFAFQVLGDILWESNKKSPDDRVLRDFDAILNDCVYTPIWQHLSDNERRVVFAIAKCKDNSVKEIREQLEMQSNEFSPYRDALSASGIIDTKTYGKVYFTLPRFEEYIKDMNM